MADSDLTRENEFDDPGLAGYELQEWKPGLAISVLWSLLALGLTIVGFVALFALTRVFSDSEGFADSVLGSVEHVNGEETTITLNLLGLGLLMLLIVGILVLHEAIHGIAFRAFGGRPTYGAAIYHRVLPVLYCTAHGHYFSRAQYAVVVLAPAVVLTLASVLIILATDLGYWIVVPAALNLGGAVGDFWIAGMLASRPAGTIVEDRKDGIRFYLPAGPVSS